MTVRTRFAPSPTGFVHIGSIRTSLYNYAFTKKQGGTYYLRIEDTDQKRYVPGSVEGLLDVLKVFGVMPDECPTQEEIQKIGEVVWHESDWPLHRKELEGINDTDFNKVLIQSLRTPLHQKYALKLLDQGAAYFCFCSEERLAKMREKQQKSGQKPMYDGLCKKYTPKEAMGKIKNGEKAVLRLDVDAYRKMKKKDVLEYKDGLMGKVQFNLKEVDDQVLIKANGIATYHLAVVVDDHLMGITHPFRGVEWLSSTPKHMMIYDLLGWEMPQYTHLTLIMDPSGGKLSKRKGNVGAHEFLAEGYMPEAILNFLMLLGWSPEDNQELFSLKEFVQAFTTERMNKNNPVFNREKLGWFNKQYISALKDKDFVERFHEWMDKYCDDKYKEANLDLFKSLGGAEDKNDKSGGRAKLEKLTPLIKERVSTWKEAVEMIRFMFVDQVEYKDEDFLAIKSENDKAKVGEALEVLLKAFEAEPWKEHTDWEQQVRDTADKIGWKHGDLFMVLRVAITGSKVSPPLFESMEILGFELSTQRIATAAKYLQN